MPDNFHFDITGAPLEESMSIAMMGAPGGKVYAWSTDRDEASDLPRLFLFWSMRVGATLLPSPMGYGVGIIDLVRSWLRDADYGPEPDIDGHCTKGWRVYNEEWGHIAHDPYAFVAIEPAWLEHGK